MSKPSRIDDDKVDFLKRLIIAHGDLQMALSAVTFLNEVDGDAEYHYIELRRLKCFETAFIISYGRAFNNNQGRYGCISLKRIGVKLTYSEKLLHDNIINLRNKIYAHSDEEYAHARVDFYKTDMPDGSDYVVPHLQFDDGLEFADLMKRLAAMDLISKIMHGLYKTVQSVGETSAGKSLYISSRPGASLP